MALAVSGSVACLAAAQQQQQTAAGVIARAAVALGGKSRILAVKTLTIEGYGEGAYQNGGGNISASPDAPQKWVSIPEYEKTIDLEHGRMRVRQRNHQNFVFATNAGYLGGATGNTTYLDGNIAYNVGPNGRGVRAGGDATRARRLDMLANPLVLVRTALDPATKVSNFRAQGSVQIVDVNTTAGEKLTLAIDPTSHLPAWVSWMEHNENLGDITLRTTFTGYLPVKGVLLPMAYNTTMNFRNIVQNKIYVDKNAVDEAIDDLAAPSDVRSAPAPPTPATAAAQASQVARGVWLLHGPGGGVGPAPPQGGRGAGGFGGGGANSVLLEFADHLTLFELPSSQAWARALIERAKTTVPGKPVTEVIVSHHHFDHTGGIRQAMADGLTIIAHKGTEGLFREIAARTGTVGSDAIGTAPKPLKFKAVDDHLTLTDSSMAVEVYHTVSNSHMAEGVFAYVPSERLLIQGDFFDVGWELYFWQNTYRDNIKYRSLQVDRDVPIHGRVLPLQQVFQDIERMTQAAERLCARTSAIGVFLPGCPIKKPSSIMATSTQ